MQRDGLAHLVSLVAKTLRANLCSNSFLPICYKALFLAPLPPEPSMAYHVTLMILTPICIDGSPNQTEPISHFFRVFLFGPDLP